MNIGVMEAGTINHNDHENVRLSKLTEISRRPMELPHKKKWNLGLQSLLYKS